ncbi:MAG TPA: tetratricopeptide repeat protein [Candidatus Acidoferrum sp.]|nr:tetratricopeptide repeat protein [Candidatus Acidoferrum sp.]
MSRYSGKVFLLVFSLGCLWLGPAILAQQSKVAATPSAASGLSPEQAITLAEQGRCRESISALKRAMSGQVPAQTRKKAGVAGLRCSLTLDDRDSAADFIRWLNKQFSHDPDILFVLVHAYSDLSTRTAQDLGRTAPQSIAAHKLNAEALEMQGKWEPAQLEYEGIIEKEPNTPGIHFLLGRLLLSRPDAGPDAGERAKQEFLKELEIDPKNAGAQYVLGELARQADKCDEAIPRFSQAAKLDSNFAEAYLGWGTCLVVLSHYEEAIPPLERAVRMQQGNPAAHYNLAVALSRTGRKEAAEKEFAIQRELTKNSPPDEPKKE